MSFGGLFDDGGGAAAGMQFPYSGAGPGVFTSSPALSLALADAVGRDLGGGRMVPAVHGGGGKAVRYAAEAENESRSGSDHLDVVSGGDFIGGEDDEGAVAELGNPRKRKKGYHRHTPYQIQELEALFKECPHPDEKQRAELSKRLSLEPRQVKFWFQNRRTQMKNQLERHENALLKQENDKLRAENLSLREAVRSPVCGGCGSAAILGEPPLEEQHLRVENARLKDELSRVCALAAKFLGKPISLMAPPQMHHPHAMPLPGSALELAVGGIGSMPSTTMAASTITEFTGTGSMSSPVGTVVSSMQAAPAPPVMLGIDKSVFLELASSAMDELVKMVQMEEPLWIRSDSSWPGSPAKETLNYEEYLTTFSPCLGVKPAGFVSEASRESGIVIIDNSAALVETFMDERRWSDMFSCMIAKASTIEVISAGVAGERNGALLLMQAELQVLSPLVPVREVTFVRFCKQLTEGAWAVVDVSVDESMRDQGLDSHMNCRRLPSGCVVQDIPNGFCKVTWVEHTEYDEASVHQLYRPLLRSGLALGAGRWLATLQRQCECLAILMSSAALLEHDSPALSSEGKRSLLKLAKRMTENFCAGVSTSSAREWSKLDGLAGNIGEDVHVMARKSVDEPGVPPGVVLSAATSVWMHATPEQLFDFLRSEGLRAEWDILSNGGPMQEVTNITKGQQDGNSISLLKANPMNTNQNSMLILQETCTDASCSMVVYAPVDIPAMQLVMNGGDSTYLALLPSGFVILPAGPSIGGAGRKTGSLLTVAFQILVNSQPTAKLTVESVETVNNLISCTINKIKAALRCDV